MKEKYEKPIIETEPFAVEMMHAGCDVGPGDVMYPPAYVPYASWGYDCDCGGPTATLS